jgi:hypothetical protein
MPKTSSSSILMFLCNANMGTLREAHIEVYFTEDLFTSSKRFEGELVGCCPSSTVFWSRIGSVMLGMPKSSLNQVFYASGTQPRLGASHSAWTCSQSLLSEGGMHVGIAELTSLRNSRQTINPAQFRERLPTRRYIVVKVRWFHQFVIAGNQLHCTILLPGIFSQNGGQ